MFIVVVFLLILAIFYSWWSYNKEEISGPVTPVPVSQVDYIADAGPSTAPNESCTINVDRPIIHQAPRGSPAKLADCVEYGDLDSMET